MRKAQARISRSRESSMKHVPAPVGGLNARDSVAAMPEQDAVILNNMFCLPDKVMLRKGSTWFSTGLGGAVETLAAYNRANGTSQRFAARTANIYDVTTAGAVGAPVVVGQTNGRWQTTNFATPGNSYLYMVNGSDSPELYNGAAWVAVTGVSVPAITGVTTSTLIHVNVFKARLFFVQKDTLSVWYLPVQSVGGIASLLDFSSFCRRGGYMVAMYTWTIDAGYGMDDHAVFITSKGEVLVYRGTDPSATATWALVGIYTIGAPIGRRCGIQYGGDLLLITADGVVPLSNELISGRINNKLAITYKIDGAISAAVSAYGSNFGWQLVVHYDVDMLILNVPTSATTAIQFVMNTITNAWASWDSLNALCWVEQDNLIYFGGQSLVFKAWNGASDPDAAGVAANVMGEALQAFSYMGTTKQKSYKMARPVIGIDIPSISVLIGVNVDYEENPPTGSISFGASSVGVWDTSTWDNATWGGSLYISKSWQSVRGYGYSAAMHIKVVTKAAQFTWSSTDYLYQTSVGI